MRYSLVNGKKPLAEKGKLGICPCCKEDTKAYCGDINISHWRHINKNDCDTWYEPITEWHIDWQDKFPKSGKKL